jgi:hypothetical protein
MLAQMSVTISSLWQNREPRRARYVEPKRFVYVMELRGACHAIGAEVANTTTTIRIDGTKRGAHTYGGDMGRRWNDWSDSFRSKAIVARFALSTGRTASLQNALGMRVYFCIIFASTMTIGTVSSAASCATTATPRSGYLKKTWSDSSRRSRTYENIGTAAVTHRCLDPFSCK